MKNFINKKLKVTWLLCRVMAASLQAQDNAFLVTNAGDTLRGNIHLIEGNALLALADGQKTFTPTEATYLYLGGTEAYRSIDFDGERRVFAQVVVGGEMSYLFYQWGKEKYHYLYYQDQLYRLKDREQTVQTPQGPKIKVISEHRLTLERLMGSCESLAPKIKKSFLAYNYMAKLVTQYNSLCSAAPSSLFVSTDYRKSKLSWGLLAGYHITSINFDTKNSLVFAAQHLEATSFEASAGPLLGAFVHVPLPGIKKNLSLRGELQWRSMAYEGYSEFDEFRADGSNPIFTLNDVSFSYHSVALAALPRWELSQSAWRPFVTVGPSLAALVNTESSRIRTVPVEGGNDQVEERTGVGFKEIEVGLVVGAGVAYKISPERGKLVILETRWMPGTGIDNLRPSVSTTQTLSVLLSYAF